MKAKIAQAVFQSGADESLAAADVYNKPVEGPMGASSSVTSDNKLMGLDSLTGSLGGVGELLSGSVSNVKGFGNLKESIGTLTKVINGDDSFIDSLKTNIAGDLLKSTGLSSDYIGVANTLMRGGDPLSALQTLSATNPQLKIISDGIEVYTKVKDVDSIEDLLSVASTITDDLGIGEMFNITAELSVMSSLINKARDLGLPNLADAIISRISDDKDKETVETNAALSLATSGNIDGLNDYLDRYGKDKLLGLYPDVLKTLLAAYHIKSENTKSDSELGQLLMQTCLKIDGQWYKTDRNGELVDHYKELTTASTDAKRVLATVPEIRHMVLSTPFYSEASLINIASKQYAYMPLSLLSA